MNDRHVVYPVLAGLLCLLAACGTPDPAADLTPTATSAPPTATASPHPTMTPSPTASPPPSPTATQGIAGYIAYRVRPGDTLESIAEEGGSDPELLLRYNRLLATPQAGRELVIPQLDGRQRRIPYRGLMAIRGNTMRPWVALTLDCGNTAGHLPGILDTLLAADVRLTFFLTGDQIADYPELLRRMAAEGHELAHHSYSHPDFTTLSDEEIAEELRRGEEVIQAALGPRAGLRPYFRFPYGAYDRRSLRAVIRAGYLPVHWSLDILDAFGEPKTPEFLVERVMALPPEELGGAIVLGHCTGATARALPTLITRLRAAGYEPRTLTDVLGE